MPRKWGGKCTLLLYYSLYALSSLYFTAGSYKHTLMALLSKTSTFKFHMCQKSIAPKSALRITYAHASSLNTHYYNSIRLYESPFSLTKLWEHLSFSSNLHKWNIGSFFNTIEFPMTWQFLCSYPYAWIYEEMYNTFVFWVAC